MKGEVTPMPRLVRAFPVLRGQEEQMRQFAREVGAGRSREAADFYARMGVVRETWHLQDTPHGPWVIAITEFGDRPIDDAARDYAASEQAFDRWFKGQVKTLTGIDPDFEPLGPPTQCIFDSHGTDAAAV
jgi:hypothetical protein